ncbi:MAG: pyridoxamine 5'-phosphate oxidase [Saprospiraceae bacterium]|nr:pyridoxamine 5'-phosphate oxidase [Saprospiraceae bacterium]
MDLKDQRQEYILDVLTEDTVDKNPFLQFTKWFEEAQERDVLEPNAMSLCTVDSEGQPSVRTVLLKYFDTSGFVFFTNHGSKKAGDMNSNPKVAVLFPWLDLQRQVRIRGRAEKISMLEASKYFASRPRGSQLGAWVSDQSQVVSNRQLLMDKFKQLKDKFSGKDVPMPKMWGGYRIVPEAFEFWQGGENRIHDRIQFRKIDDGWVIERLMP